MLLARAVLSWAMATAVSSAVLAATTLWRKVLHSAVVLLAVHWRLYSSCTDSWCVFATATAAACEVATPSVDDNPGPAWGVVDGTNGLVDEVVPAAGVEEVFGVFTALSLLPSTTDALGKSGEEAGVVVDDSVGDDVGESVVEKVTELVCDTEANVLAVELCVVVGDVVRVSVCVDVAVVEACVAVGDVVRVSVCVDVAVVEVCVVVGVDVSVVKGDVVPVDESVDV